MVAVSSLEPGSTRNEKWRVFGPRERSTGRREERHRARRGRNTEGASPAAATALADHRDGHPRRDGAGAARAWLRRYHHQLGRRGGGCRHRLPLRILSQQRGAGRSSRSPRGRRFRDGARTRDVDHARSTFPRGVARRPGSRARRARSAPRSGARLGRRISVRRTVVGDRGGSPGAWPSSARIVCAAGAISSPSAIVRPTTTFSPTCWAVFTCRRRWRRSCKSRGRKCSTRWWRCSFAFSSRVRVRSATADVGTNLAQRRGRSDYVGARKSIGARSG